jgi:hypothetical protein
MSKEMFGVDKFVVPAHAREEFLMRVHATPEVLRTQSGFVGSKSAPISRITNASNGQRLLNNEELHENADQKTLQGLLAAKYRAKDKRNQWPEAIVDKFVATVGCAK